MQSFKTLTILLLLISQVGCGNNGSQATLNEGDNQQAEGGISGTGISMGPVTGFGSIFVNGVKYEVNQTQLLRNGKHAAGQNDFSIGEQVIVELTLDAEQNTEKAERILFRDSLRGEVTGSGAALNQIEVMGQIIETGLRTVFIDFKELNTLVLGDLVQISGSRDSENVLHAASIKKLDNLDSYKISGPIMELDTTAKTFKLKDIVIDYAAAPVDQNLTLANDLLIEVESAQALDNMQFTADALSEEPGLPELPEGTELTLEGIVTRYQDISNFSVNGLDIVTDSNSNIEEVLDILAQDVKVSVSGEINASGALLAALVELREGQNPVQVSGNIQSIDGNQLILESSTIIVKPSTFLTDLVDNDYQQMNLEDFRSGDFIQVDGNELQSESILAAKVTRKEPEHPVDEKVTVQGTPHNINLVTGRFDINETTVQLTDATQITHPGGEAISVPELLNLLFKNQLEITAIGIKSSDDILIAEEATYREIDEHGEE